MKKGSPSYGQKGQLVQSWALVHSGYQYGLQWKCQAATTGNGDVRLGDGGTCVEVCQKGDVKQDNKN